jgi:hypothetical protein
LRLREEAANGAIVVVVRNAGVEHLSVVGPFEVRVVLGCVVLVNKRVPPGAKQRNAAKQGRNGPNRSFLQA